MAIQKQKVQFFQDTILDFFAKSGREELPWRTKGIGAYEVWVSEIMLQQTQVTRVLTYYTRFLQRFPTVLDLAAAAWEDFLPYYEGLGYYNRGRNMLRTAVMVRDSFGGVFPKTREELLQLPGVGEYTAAAIRSFAYNQDALAWDTNLKRVMRRFFFGDKKAILDEPFFAGALTAPKKELNAALMDFGSAICKAKPQCGNCPLRQKCQYHKTKGENEAVAAKTKVAFPMNEARAVVFLHKDHREYYSRGKQYQPFVLPAGQTSRAAVKQWFLENYQLRLSVRPPHQKTWQENQPVLLVNAQILSGEHTFTVFSKKQVAEYTKSTF